MKILARVLSGAAAAGAALAAAAVVVVAIAFAVYAFAKTYLGPAGGSAVTALVFAVVLGIGVAIASASAGKGRRRKPKHAEPERADLIGRIMETARERPFVAAAGAVAAGLLALRNPALVATVLGLINQPPRPRRD